VYAPCRQGALIQNNPGPRRQAQGWRRSPGRAAAEGHVPETIGQDAGQPRAGRHGQADLLRRPDEFWEALARDQRIVRNPQKIKAVRHNAAFVSEMSQEHGGFGKFLAEWPTSDQVGLLDLLAKRGSRLGGRTGQYFLRFVGKDSFVTSGDVVACLRDAGLDISESPSSKKDLLKIQHQFNAWVDETGLPLTHLSRICAMSIGENYDAETMRRRGGVEEEE
jgi:3-methyladenine DNA glycosylase Tag